MPRGLEPSTLLWAVGWDVLLGDIPEEADPVGIATRAADALEARAPQNSYVARTVYAMGAAFALPYAAWLGTKWILGAAGLIHSAIYREAATALLKGAISIRGSLNALRELEQTVEESATGEIVADDVNRLIREAGMAESVTGAVQEASSELQQQQRSHALRKLGNDFRDGVVGPLLYFAIFGIPGAVAYRVVKTLAARWRRHGNDPLAVAAKRIDTAATIAPAVATSLVLAAGAQLTSQRGQEAWETSRAEARTRGNVLEGGWTEAAMAGALGVKLDAEPDLTDWEPDTNPEGRNIEAEDIENARQLFWIATAWAVAATLAAIILRGSITSRRR